MTPPYLRFGRDKRGYENTFVIHTDRRRGRARTRVLYWFRTPPGVRVGRSALDEAARKLIERHNPDVEFDWPKLLKGQGTAETSAPARAAPVEPPARTLPPARPARQEDSTSSGPRREAPRNAGRALPPARVAPPDVSAAAGPPVESGSTAPTTTSPSSGIDPARLEGTMSCVEARLGIDTVARLRARHGEILIRITERVDDGGRRTELKEAAERLNPDNWQSDDEVRRGVEAYEVALEAIRAVVGQGRRRAVLEGEGIGPRASSGPAGGQEPESQTQRQSAAEQEPLDWQRGSDPV